MVPGSISSVTILEGNPAVVRLINSDNEFPFPVAAYDINDSDTCVFVSDHPNHWSSAIHFNVDLHADFGEMFKYIECNG